MTGRRALLAAALSSGALTFAALSAGSLGALSLGAAPAGAQALRVTNHHEIPYAGPVRFFTQLPDGRYAARAKDGAAATADIRGGVARVVGAWPAGAATTLRRTGAERARPFAAGPFAAVPDDAGVALRWRDRAVGSLDFDLVVLPGTTGDVSAAVAAYAPMALRWTSNVDGSLTARGETRGIVADLTMTPYGAGFVDVATRVYRAAGGDSAAPAYLALVRRVTSPSTDARLRFNGRRFSAAESPDTWDRDFWYTRGVDWSAWNAGPVQMVAVNGFTPVPTTKRGKNWAEGSHFYVWERTRRMGDATYLIAEVAGPNPDQEKSRYMPVRPYAPLARGDTVDMKWRLAIDDAPEATWEDSQLRAFAGYRLAHDSVGVTIADIGVPSTTFGTAYFPYSTLTENFDFYRTPGLDRETFWAFSPDLWKHWRELEPRMRTDLHIVRAMGFSMVRLHHLELLQKMGRADAFAFLDWFTGEARANGLHLLMDSEGPTDWIAELARRYAGTVTRFELENEILIGGIKPPDAARWTAQYRAIKAAAPDAQVFLTGAGNNGQFERLQQLGVPFDRVGLHAYKHGPQWIEAYSSHALGSAGYASDLGKPMTIGEFNWKELTRMSPAERLPKVRQLYQAVLGSHAVPELFEFQLQESLSFNGAVAGGFTRHYEPLGTDRRPKPEAAVLESFIREYGPKDAPVNALPIEVYEARFTNGVADASFVVENNSGRPVTVTLRPVEFDGPTPTLLTERTFTLPAGARHTGRVRLAAPVGAMVGTYHHFVEATYDTPTGSRTAVGWGVASMPGAPTFTDSSVLGAALVRWDGGASLVRQVKWERPLAVVFGGATSVLELESAFRLANTLQSATGRPVWISAAADLPDSLKRVGTVLFVGAPPTDSVYGPTGVTAAPKQGVVTLREMGGAQWLYLTGADRDGAHAAAMDLVLRYWPHAKDAMMRLTGMEKGSALGNRSGVGETDLP